MEGPDLSKLKRFDREDPIRMFLAQAQEDQAPVVHLEARLAKNSHDSRKPSSINRGSALKLAPKSLRHPGQSPKVGQEGEEKVMVPTSVSSGRGKWAALTAGALSGLLMSSGAWAMPSFARQTGWSCAACHTSYPQLTPMGREFKLLGYTTINLQRQQKIEAELAKTVHVLLPRISQFSIFLQASDTHVAGGQAVLKNPPSVSGSAPNNNVEFPQQVSLFYAGEITPHLGSFLHLTYGGQTGGLGFDDSSIVWAHPWKLNADSMVVTGVDVNNTPTSTDLWNTVPDWQAPFFNSDYVPGAPATFIENSAGAAYPMAGAGAYVADLFGANHANWLYLEADTYTNATGNGTMPNTIGAFAPNDGRLASAAPYVRLAYQHNWSDWNWEVGTYGMWSRVYESPVSTASSGAIVPAGSSSGPVDQFNDYDLDSQLQWLNTNSNSNLTVRVDWIHEHQAFGSTTYSSLSSGSLNSMNLNATYWYHDHYAAQGGYQRVYGPANPGFWGTTYSPSGSPNTSDEWIEASYLPWWNTRLSLRYTLYNKFQGLGGATSTTVAASKFNTVELLAWLAY